MRALLLIAKNNLKKRKGDVAVLLLLTSLATLLLYTSISVLAGTDEVVQRAYERAHTADFFFMTNLGEEEKIADLLQSQPEVEEYEQSECYYFLDSQYRKNRSEEKIDFSFILGIADQKRTIGALPEEAGTLRDDEILLPFYLKSSCEIGEEIELTLGEEEFVFTVGGYVEDPLFATPMNVSVYNVYLTGSRMEQILKMNPSIADSHYLQHKVCLTAGSDCVAFEERVSSLLTKKIPALSYGMNLSINWETMKSGLTLMSSISMGIILIFSMLLIVVALLIVRFSMKNFLERNLKNIGMQLAAGYTAKQLRLISVIEAAWMALFGIGSGIVLGVACSSLIGQFQGRMLGLSWKQGFHAPAAILSMLLVFAVLTLATGISGRVFRRMSVLDALRGGIHIHNFRKNHFPFEKSRLPFGLVLAGKNILGEKKKNLSIGCMVLLLVFATCMGFCMYENFAVHTGYLMRLIGIETGDLFLFGPQPTAVGGQMEDWPQVERILYYNSINVRVSKDGTQRTISCDVWNQPELLQNEMLLRGRIPQYENEIVLTVGVAEALKVDVGDTVYVEGEGERLDYLVCGVDQKINNLGMKAMLHSAGARRLNQMREEEELYTVLYAYVREQVTYEQMAEKIHRAFPDVSVSDGQKMTEESLSNVSGSMTAICVIFVLTTFFVVALVELLLVHARVLREQKYYGIAKALGYTTRQLIVQTVMLNLPVILLGTLAGIVFSQLCGNSVVVFFLSTVGIQECELSFSPFWMLTTAVDVLAVATLASLLGAIRIGRIEPVELLRGE